MKKLKENKGITLIALVVTIVVLIILAVISVNAVLGENGIIGRAEKAKLLKSHGEVEEGIKLAYVDYEFEQKTGTTAKIGKETKLASEEVAIKLAAKGETFLDYLIRMGYTDSNGVVDVEALLGHNTGYGQESGNIDVYKVEASEEGYDLNYYGKEGEKTELAVLESNRLNGDTDTEPEEDEIAKVEPENIDDWEYRIEEDGTATLTMYKGDDTEVVVPNYIDDYPVKEIEYNNITGSIWGPDICEELTDSYGEIEGYRQNTITKVIISNGIKIIDDRAFDDSKVLEEITIPDSIISIGDYAFAGSPWEGNLPNGEIYLGKVYYKYKGTMPENTKIVVRDGTKSIASYAFEFCSNLTSIEIPDSVISIGNYAFNNCSNLTSIEIPDSVINIGKDTFNRTPWFDNKQNEDGLVIVNNKLIDASKASGEITIPEGVISIAERAFDYNTNVTSIEIPDSVINIGDYAFSNCRNLTSIEIPNSVTNIGDSAFSDCSNLTTVNYGGTASQWNKINIDHNGNSNILKAKIITTDEIVKVEPENIDDWEYRVEADNTITLTKYKGNDTEVVIPNYINDIPVKTIGRILWANEICEPREVDVGSDVLETVYYQKTITKVIVSAGIEIIEKSAFRRSEALEEIVIPFSIKSLGYDMLYGCNNLATVKYGGTSARWNIIKDGDLTNRDFNIEYNYSE